MKPRIAKLRSALARAHQSPHPDPILIAELRAQLAEEMASKRAQELAAQVGPLPQSARLRVADILRPVLSTVEVSV